MTASLTDQLASLVGGAQMLPPESLPGYLVGGLTPEAVAQPETREAISQVMEWASRTGAAVAPWGGGTQQGLGNVPARLDLALDVSRCNRVLDFQPEDLTVTVEAGITLEALQRQLSLGGKHLAVEAPQPAKATVGGILAVSATGPRRFAYGTPRDWLIGISVVAADGSESKAGGRVVKNVSGYDLNKLYTGSLGTLGVIVEATFKVSPAPLYFRALIASFRSNESAVNAAQILAKQSYAPQGLLVLNHVAAGQMSHLQIKEVLRGAEVGQALVAAFFEGRDEAMVQGRLSSGANLLGSHGAGADSPGADFIDVVHLNPEDSSSLLAEATDVGWEPEAAPYLALKLNVPPSAVSGVVHAASQPLPLGQTLGIVVDPGFGTVRLLWRGSPGLGPASDQRAHNQAEFDGPVSLESIEATIDRVREFTHEAGGTAVAEWCPLALKHRIDIWDGAAHGEREIQIMRRIKEQFDPAGILNPGRFLGGI